MDYEGVVKFTLAWAKNKTSLKYYLVLFAIPIVLLAVLGVLFYASFAPFLTQLASGNLFNILGIVNDLMAVLFSLIAWLSIVFLVFAVINLAVSLWIYNYGLKSKNLPTRGLSFNVIISIVALTILSIIRSLFFAPGKRTRYVQWAGLVGMILGILVVPILYPLAFLVYLAAIFYSSIRMSMGGPLVLSKGTPISDSLNESWTITSKKVVDMVVASILVVVVLIVISIIVNAILTMLFTPVAAGFTAALPLGALAAQVNNFVAGLIASFFFTPFMNIAYIFFHVGLFAEVSK
jgi:hypothetical protein